MVPDVKPLVDIVSDRMPAITPTVAVTVIVLMGTPKKHAQMIFLIFLWLKYNIVFNDMLFKV